jgi:hypothetical protein
MLSLLPLLYQNLTIWQWLCNCVRNGAPQDHKCERDCVGEQLIVRKLIMLIRVFVNFYYLYISRSPQIGNWSYKCIIPIKQTLLNNNKSISLHKFDRSYIDDNVRTLPHSGQHHIFREIFQPQYFAHRGATIQIWH